MYFPVLLCTTKLAQSTSMYNFALQSLHKARPSTTLYYKACTKHFPARLCTRKFAHNTFQNTSSFDTQQALPHSKLLHTASFYSTKNALTHSKLSRRKTFTQRTLSHTESFYTENFTHSKLLNKDLLHRETFWFIMTTAIAAPKPNLSAKANKNTVAKHFLKGILKGKSPAPKLRKFADKSPLQP